MKLNPTQSAFRVTSWKFLNFMVTFRDIEANLENIATIINMQELNTMHVSNLLSGNIAALSKFLSKSRKKSFPFFKTLEMPLGAAEYFF